MTGTASPSPIRMWLYDAAPATYRALAPEPDVAAGGKAFIIAVPAEYGRPAQGLWLRQFFPGARCHRVGTVLPEDDVIYIGTPPTEPRLYEQLDDEAGATAVADRSYERVLADHLLAAYVAGLDTAGHLAAFLRGALDWARVHEGPDPEAHAHLGLSYADFDTVVGHLTETLREFDHRLSGIAELVASGREAAELPLPPRGLPEIWADATRPPVPAQCAGG